MVCLGYIVLTLCSVCVGAQQITSLDHEPLRRKSSSQRLISVRSRVSEILESHDSHETGVPGKHASHATGVRRLQDRHGAASQTGNSSRFNHLRPLRSRNASTFTLPTDRGVVIKRKHKGTLNRTTNGTLSGRVSGSKSGRPLLRSSDRLSGTLTGKDITWSEHNIDSIISGQLVRLQPGDVSYYSGTVSVLHLSRWRHICSQHWTQLNSNVTCKQLGYKQGALLNSDKVSEDMVKTARHRTVTHSSDMTNVLLLVTCRGNESRLQDCHVTVDESRKACTQRGLASVQCIPNEGCENGWLTGDGMCYKLVTSRGATLETADKTCQSMESHLLRIDSQSENDFVSNWLRTTSESRVWMAGHRSGGSGAPSSWKWFGTSNQIRFTKWFPGFPPNSTRRQPMATENRDCISLSSDFFDQSWTLRNVHYFYWQNWPCSNSLSFVCRKAVPLDENECYEDGNGVSYRGRAHTTVRGSVCQPWTDSSKLNPITHPYSGLGRHNYCRNPDGDRRPWCWVDTKQHLFGYCALIPCNASCIWEKEMRCEGGGGGGWAPRCIPLTQVCDGRQDCDDGSDEVACRRHQFQVRLVGGANGTSHALEGRVEVTVNNMTGTVCDDSWDDDSASVVCRMLGYSDGMAVDFAGYGQGQGPIWLDDVRCTGSESHLLDCDSAPIGENNCGHSEDAGVRCLPASPRGSGEELECGKRPIIQPRARIVGGNFARYGAFPWQARILKLNPETGEFQHNCGGTIISRKWVLSAAHCFEFLTRFLAADSFRVRVGDHHNNQVDQYEQEFAVDQILPHPHYTSSTFFSAVSYDYDIALVRLRSHIQFNDYVQPACLPPTITHHPHSYASPTTASSQSYRPGRQCEVSGWGLSRQYLPLTLKSGMVPIISQHQCNTVYRSTLSQNMFCAGHSHGAVDTCQGDSGGPLVCNINGSYTVLGITSWGQGCGRRNSPGVYTKVGVLTDWIRRSISRYN